MLPSNECLMLQIKMGICVENLGVGLSSWHPGSQLLPSSCHLIPLVEQLLIPVHLPVTNQQ